MWMLILRCKQPLQEAPASPGRQGQGFNGRLSVKLETTFEVLLVHPFCKNFGVYFVVCDITFGI